jgi:hypothetical protein
MKTINDTGVAGMQNYVSMVTTNTMSNASHSMNDSDKAWTLRRGIDSLRVRLGQASP